MNNNITLILWTYILYIRIKVGVEIRVRVRVRVRMQVIWSINTSTLIPSLKAACILFCVLCLVTRKGVSPAHLPRPAVGTSVLSVHHPAGAGLVGGDAASIDCDREQRSIKQPQG